MRWLVYIAAAIAIVGVVVAIIGYSLPKAHSVSRTTTIAMPPDALYALLADVDRYPAWRPGVKSLQRHADRDGKPAWTEEAGGMTIPLYFERMDRPGLLVSRIADPSLPFGGTWTYRIQPAGAGSQLTITEDGEVYNPFFRFMSRFVFGHTATLDEFVENLESRTAAR
ncbi:MAG TPA: SRPBCC family protein [Vicinamibacterales bacterium]|nr:SRPBCC family protein [Vicinamibacterales bacterium]